MLFSYLSTLISVIFGGRFQTYPSILENSIGFLVLISSTYLFSSFPFNGPKKPDPTMSLGSLPMQITPTQHNGFVSILHLLQTLHIHVTCFI